MKRTTVSKALAAPKAELEEILAEWVVAQHPDLYRGHFDDALKFVRKHLGPSRDDLLLAIESHGLATADSGGIAAAGWSYKKPVAELRREMSDTVVGKFVRFEIPALVGKFSQDAGTRTIRGRVTRVLENGNLEVRAVEGGYHKVDPRKVL